MFFVRAVERNNLWKKEDKNGFPIIMIVMLNEAFQILFFAEELSFQDLCRQNYETLVKRNKLNLGQLLGGKTNNCAIKAKHLQLNGSRESSS